MIGRVSFSPRNEYLRCNGNGLSSKDGGTFDDGCGLVIDSPRSSLIGLRVPLKIGKAFNYATHVSSS